MQSFDSSDDVMYLKKGRHQAKRTRRPGFKMDGITLYLFVAFIITLVLVSIFTLYDNFLYQNSYDKLMNIWIQHEDNQDDLDQLNNEMTDREITPKKNREKITMIKEDINKNKEDLKKIGISNRHMGLVDLKKELALLTGGLYKVGESKEEVINLADNDVDNKSLLELKEQNIKVIKKEEEVINVFYKTLPFERKIYEGYTPTSLLAAIKGR